MTLTDSAADPFRDVVDEDFRAALARGHRRPAGARAAGDVAVLRRRTESEGNRRGAEVTESRVCQLHGQALVRLKARLAGWREPNRESMRKEY